MFLVEKEEAQNTRTKSTTSKTTHHHDLDLGR
jgi:hypothetical protein